VRCIIWTNTRSASYHTIFRYSHTHGDIGSMLSRYLDGCPLANSILTCPPSLGQVKACLFQKYEFVMVFISIRLHHPLKGHVRKTFTNEKEMKLMKSWNWSHVTWTVLNCFTLYAFLSKSTLYGCFKEIWFLFRTRAIVGKLMASTLLNEVFPNFRRANILSGPNQIDHSLLLLVTQNSASASPVWPSLYSAGKKTVRTKVQ